MSNYRSVDTRWDGVQKANVCSNCASKPTTAYIATGHDHTDQSVTLCTCGTGLSFQEVWKEVVRVCTPTHPMEYYKQYFLTEETKVNDKVNVQVNDVGRFELTIIDGMDRLVEACTVPSISEYQWNVMVIKLAKPGADILATLSPDKVDLLHAVIGISGEAGELLDMVKKIVIYNRPLDEAALANIIEELGDLEFYMQQLRNNKLVLTTRLATLAANHHKLVGKANARYASGSYSDQQAQTRADKQEVQPE